MFKPAMVERQNPNFLRATKVALSAVALAFLFGQCFLTIRNINAWPMSSHNFFAFIPPEPVVRLIFRAADAKGNWTEPMHVGQAMPVEFFRANQIVMQVVRGQSAAEAVSICALMVRYLREQRNLAFDETMRPAPLPKDFDISIGEIAAELRSYDSKSPKTRGTVVLTEPLVRCASVQSPR